ncbi:MAG: FIST C-terminal domain-containing protein [Planctomycetales bacterium]|nr:FIST C-terminal domain-containing protein [Planctomycetales bacterium]
MTFTAASVLHTGDVDRAAAEVIAAIGESLGRPVDLLVVFFSSDYVGQIESLSAELQRQLQPRVMLGAQGEAIVGRGEEIEERPALSVWAASLPGVPLHSMHLRWERTPDGGVFSGWPADLAESWPDEASLIVLGDPFSFPADALLERMAEDHADCVVAGGMASGAQAPGQLRLLRDGQVLDQGAVAVLIERPARLRCVVSQGCRPIGEPMIVTKAERNVILELGGQPALERLETLFHSLPNHEQALVQRGLHLGRVINEYQDAFEAGDFLIRNVTGLDPDTGAVVVGDYFRVGQTVQFHLRDESSASRELNQLLEAAAGQPGQPSGGLLFTCNGRGTRMFEQPHHDASAVERHFPGLPLAGLFAMGEIGPVGGKSFMHGFTACLALLQHVDARADTQ